MADWPVHSAPTCDPKVLYLQITKPEGSLRQICDILGFELRNSDTEPILRLVCDAVWRPRHSSLYCVTGKTTVLHAAETIGVNRSTIYRWIASKKLTQDDEGLVDIDKAYALKKAQRLGRKSGKAHPDYETNRNEEIDRLLDRAIGTIASVWRNAKPHHRNWVIGKISKLNDEEHQQSQRASLPKSPEKIVPKGKFIEEGNSGPPQPPLPSEPIPKTQSQPPSQQVSKTQPPLPSKPTQNKPPCKKKDKTEPSNQIFFDLGLK